MKKSFTIHFEGADDIEANDHIDALEVFLDKHNDEFLPLWMSDENGDYWRLEDNHLVLIQDLTKEDLDLLISQ